MKHRSFMTSIQLLVAISIGTNAVANLAAGDTVGYGFAVIAVGYLGVAGYYWLHPTPIERPDDSAPRRWFELAGLAAVVLVVTFGILEVTVG